MNKIFISICIAFFLVGSIFYAPYKKVMADGQYATAYNSVSVQHIITEEIPLGEGSYFTPMWKRQVYVQIAKESTSEALQLEVVEVVEESEEIAENSFETTTESEESIIATESTMIITPNPTPFQEEAVIRDFLLQEIFRLTNEERKAAGLQPLRLNSELNQLAQVHSDDMVTVGYFAHEDVSGCALTCRVKKSKLEPLAWAENIVVLHKSHLLSQEEIAAELMESWLESGGHRENILHPSYTHVGIGFAYDGNSLYVTSDFAELK